MRTSKHRQKTSKEILDNGKAIPYSWCEEIIIMKMSILSKVIYRLDVIHIRIPMLLFKELEKKGKSIQESTWNYRRPQVAKGTLGRKAQLEALWIYDFKSYYRATVINAEDKLGTETNGAEHRNQRRHPKYAVEKKTAYSKER